MPIVECTTCLWRSEYVLINPVLDQVTHLVVKENSSPTQSTCTVDSVTETKADTIRLRCSKAELERWSHLSNDIHRGQYARKEFSECRIAKGMGMGTNTIYRMFTFERTFKRLLKPADPPGNYLFAEVPA